jgi:hypothetical protein
MMLSALVMQAQSTAPVLLLSRSSKMANASDSAVVMRVVVAVELVHSAVKSNKRSC